MSTTKTEKSIYKSASTDEFCTAQQYIVEILMNREAKKAGKSLPLRFWNIDQFKKKYIGQIFKTNALIKAFDDKSVVAAIINNSWLHSIFYPKLGDLIQKESDKLKSQVKDLDKVQNFDELDVDSFRPVVTQKKNNMKSKLDE